MANIPSHLKYTQEHEWVETVGKDRVRVGITDYAQRQLGDIVFIEMPKVGDAFEIGQPFGTVESVKSVSDLYAPLSGKIAAVNDTLVDDPEWVNSDPYGDGWIIEIEPSKAAELKELLTAAAYETTLSEA
ncbi:glycine cleavage system protein GcvH [Kitasatospora brasiliensis]|uniref:glycine cleavage system protein GcvH n=1 Tax=Kitasatospora brasiliensis TaxID=3058040 RepID=UPI00292E9999|nr:glycine cleavage system protein GcvH [Kitasatospora sp. K002]